MEPASDAPGAFPPATLRQRFETHWRDPSTRPLVLCAAVAAALLGSIYWRNLLHLVLSWANEENYSHGFLVPFISLYFANQASLLGPVRRQGGAVLGMTLLVGATLVKLATVIIPYGTFGDLAFVVSIAGMCALLAGRDALRRYGFAIGFLFFMVPMPVALYAAIASPLQLFVSKVASLLLNATNVPVLTEGNMMTLPGGVQMFVAEACSGMRQLTGFLALTAAVAYLIARPAWYKTAVILASIPVALTANIARVMLTGYIMYFVNPKFASGTFHTVEGILMLGFGLALLRAWCGMLDLILAVIQVPDAAPPRPPHPEPRPPARPSRRVVEHATVDVAATPLTFPTGGAR